MEHGLLNHCLKENISELTIMESQLIGKHLLVHGKDGTYKDMDLMFIFKVGSLLISIGLIQDQFCNN